MRIFVIPTHRKITRALDSVLAELREAGRISREEEFSLLIIDTSVPEVAAFNRDILRKRVATSSFPFKTYYFDPEAHTKLIDKLAQSASISRNELTDLLHIRSVDYGKVFNLLYLYAAMFDADSLHRRDSDCYVDSGSYRFMPVENEFKFIGKKLGPVAENIEIVDEIQNYEDELLIVGSDYYGNWNLDLEELAGENREYLIEYLKIYGVAEEYIDTYIKAKYTSPAVFRERPVLMTSGKVRNYPDCGNIAMKDVFKWIPNFIGEFGVGFDYHTYNISYFSKIPILYHQHKIKHTHEVTRKNPDARRNYWIGLLKNLDYDLLVTQLRENAMPALLEKSRGLGLVKEIAASILPDALEKSLDALDRNYRLARFQQLADMLLSSGKEGYLSIGEYLSDSKTGLIDVLDDDYKKSIQLQRYWPALIHEVSKFEDLKNSYIAG